MKSFVPVCLLLLAPLQALADASEGLKLLQQNRVREAREEFERGAAGNDPQSRAMLTLFLWHGYDRRPERARACHEAADPALANESMAQAILARCYLTGTGVKRDLEKARTLARASALGGNNEARYIYYLAVRSTRVIGARTPEVEAIDMLARAAQTGHRDSQIALAGYYFDTVGEGNRKRAGTLFAQIPNLPESAARDRAALADFERIAGDSPLTVRILREAQPSAIAATVGAGGSVDCRDIRLMSTAPAGSVQEPFYLPHTHPWVERTYLVRGNWEEDWRYEVCGKQIVVRMRFEADGKSGAYFRPASAR